MSKNSTVTATFLGSPYTAGAYVFTRLSENDPWSGISFSIIDSRGENPVTITWAESLDLDQEPDFPEGLELRNEFIDWINKSKTELPDEA